MKPQIMRLARTCLPLSLSDMFANCDPQSNTHDTQQLAVVLNIISALGVKLKLLVYQPPNNIAGFAEAFSQAGKEADIVVMYLKIIFGKRLSMSYGESFVV